MTNEELILQRLEAIEAKISPLVKTAEDLRELKADLTPLGNKAFQLMIEGLQEVEAGFRLEDLMYLSKQLMRNVQNFSYLVQQMQNVIEFISDIEPLLKSAVPNIIRHLDILEQKGVFRIIKSTLDVRAKVADAYTPEDIDAIGNGMVALLGLTKKLNDPSTIAFLEKTTEILSEVDLVNIKPVGPCGMTASLFNSEIKNGLGVLMALTKAMGKMKCDGNDVEAKEPTAVNPD